MPSTSRGSRRDFAALEARRYEAARLFARGASQAAVARALGATRAAAHRWFHAWQDEGRTGLKAAGRAGRKPRLEAPQLARVEGALLKGPRAHGFATELWTLPRVAIVIERLTHVRYHPGHVWYLLRRLGWSLQRPTRQARERDEAAIAQWKRERWPQVKKTRAAGARGSSSKTRAASRIGRSSAARGPRAATRRS
jgi:transposase